MTENVVSQKVTNYYGQTIEESAGGVTKEYEYDYAGNLTREYPYGDTGYYIDYTYDHAGRLIGQRDKNGIETKTVYDSLGSGLSTLF